MLLSVKCMAKKNIKNEKSKPAKQGKKKKPLVFRTLNIAVFVISLYMCIQQMHELYLHYLTDPIDTLIKVTLNNAMEFPAVTVCNLNPVRRSVWTAKLNGYNTNQARPTWLGEESKIRFRDKLQRVRTSATRKNNAARRRKDLAASSYFSSYECRDYQRQIAVVEDHTLNVIPTLRSLHKSPPIKDIYSLQSNITSLNKALQENLQSLESFDNIVRELEKLVNFTEQSNFELAQEMTDVQNYIKSEEVKNSQDSLLLSKLDMTLLTDDEDKHQSVGEEEFQPSKDTEAFNNYLQNIGKMTTKDIALFGHQKEDFIAICSWKGGICHPSHFTAFQNFMYGNCFTFNSSNLGSQVSGTGPYNGLSLSLFIEQNEYIDRVAPAAGARVIIHDHNHKPFPDEEGFSVAPGYTTSVFLRKSTTVAVKPICDPDIESLHQKNTSGKGTKDQYSQKACLKQCLSDEILRQCNCSGRQFLLDQNTCSPDIKKEVECVERLERLAREDKLPCYCPTPCRSTTYNPMTSSASWPAEKYLPSLIEELIQSRHKVLDSLGNVTDYAQYFKKNFLRIDIFFQELTEEEILLRHSYGLEGLLSDIGGQLGLWIGVSVVTLVQSIKDITLFVGSVCRWIQRKTSRKKKASPIYDDESAQDTSSRKDDSAESNHTAGGAMPTPAEQASLDFLYVNIHDDES